MDYQRALYNPIYRKLGVPVSLTLADARVFPTITAIDKTAGEDVGDNVNVPTIKPVAAFRVHELQTLGIVFRDLPKATLTMNGFQWNVANFKLKPSPMGELDGEVYLILTGKVLLSEEESEP